MVNRKIERPVHDPGFRLDFFDKRLNFRRRLDLFNHQQSRIN